jgi:hypothetical protein
MSIHKTEALLSRIRTEHVFPPIPLRQFDWSAVLDDYDPGCPIGQGPTEEAAVADLLDQISDAE